MEKTKSNENNKKQEIANENYMAMGMCLGMCIGSGIGITIGAITNNIGVCMCFGVSIGMCIGMGIGSAIKKDEKNNKK